MFDLICHVLHENAKNGILPAYVSDISPTPEMCLSDLGLDSLGKLTVLSELCGRLGIPQIDLDLQDHISLGEFGRMLSSAAAKHEAHLTEGASHG